VGFQNPYGDESTNRIGCALVVVAVIVLLVAGFLIGVYK
jgi:hypothetical protein